MTDPFADDVAQAIQDIQETYVVPQFVTGEEVHQWILDNDSTRDAWWQLQDGFREFIGAMTWLCDAGWTGGAEGFKREFADRMIRVEKGPGLLQ